MPEIPRGPDVAGGPKDPVFSEPWEAQAFAMVVALQARGLFTWAEWAAQLSRCMGDNASGSYYEQWLAALEHMVMHKGVASAEALAQMRTAWTEAAERTPHGQAIVLEGVLEAGPSRGAQSAQDP